MSEAAPLRRARAGFTGFVIAFGAAIVVTTEFVVIGLSPMMADTLQLSVESSGRFVTWFALGSAIAGPFVTLLTRRLSSQTVLILALLPFAANLCMPWLRGPDLVYALRFLQGATLPMFIGAASEALSRVLGRDDQAISRVYLGTTVGSVLGAPFGAVVAAETGWIGAFVVLGILSLIAALLVLRQPGLDTKAQAGSSVRADLALTVRPWVIAHLVLSVVQFAAMFCSYAFLSLILRMAGIGEEKMGLWLFVFGMGGIAGNLAVEHVARRTTRAAAIITAATIAAAGLAAAYLLVHAQALFPVLLLWGAAHAASFAVCQLRVTRCAPEAPRFAAVLNIAAANVGIAVGPLLGGFVLQAAGIQGLGWTGFALGALSMVMAIAFRHAPAHHSSVLPGRVDRRTQGRHHER